MEEMEIDGKKYLSSKQAAKATGYAKDYVGQLCREGRVEAKLIGRSWYVYEKSILEHRFGSQAPDVEPIRAVEDSIEDSTQNTELITEVDHEISEITNKQATWESPTYVPEIVEEVVPLSKPEIATSPMIQENHLDQDEKGVTEMQEAWKSWFESTPGMEIGDTSRNEYSAEEVAVPVQIVPEARNEPHTEVYSDIEHIRPVIQVRQPDTFTQAPQRKIEKQAILLKEQSWIAYKALSVAIVIIIVSLTLVALGIITPLTNHTVRNIGALNYIAGETRI